MSRLSLSLLATLALAGASLGQAPYFPTGSAFAPQPVFPAGPDFGSGGPDSFGGPGCEEGAPCSRCRFEASYLLWYFKRNDIATPLLTTTRDPGQDLGATFAAGGLADPNTAVLFGRDPNSGQPYHGGAAALVLDPAGPGAMGAELRGLWLPRQGQRVAVASNAAGVPAIALPFFNVNPAFGPVGETAGIFAGLFGGAPLVGRAEVRTATQLWGGEANWIGGLPCCCGCARLDLLVGFRYLGMNDLLTVFAGITGGGTGATFDRFYTENHFYGGQLGLRATLGTGSLQGRLTSKAALGTTRQTLDIRGAAVLPAFALTGAPQLPGGFYTASSNIGRTTRGRFAVVSDTNFTAVYYITPSIGLSAGYSFLYWSSVLRTGDQIDPRLNPNLNPAFSALGTPGAGERLPARLENRTDFWAHGLNAGLEFRF